MQEGPEPVSTEQWGNCIDIHPTTAAALKVADGDIVALNPTYDPQFRVEGAIRVTTDVADGVLALQFGQGHEAMGRNAAGRGFNAFDIWNPSQSNFGTVTLRPTGRKAAITFATATQDQHGREILRWVKLSTLRTMGEGEGEPVHLPLPEYYGQDDTAKPHRYKAHRWGMVIDLDRCIGCGACAIACQAENNVAVVGPAEAAKGRIMNWLRVIPYRHPQDPRRMGFLPLPCQHCDCAPCEPVCPVFASVHNEEGLNSQVYNRCIGTRYCSNNCPYKVRRFNWLDHEWPTPLDWQLNPDCTVRERGVMEKCTFCIQRIRRAQRRARLDRRKVRDGEIQPACAQSCPTKANSPFKIEELGRLLRGRQSPVRYWTLTGALCGLVGGFALAIGSAAVNGLWVGGRFTPQAFVPYCVVGFEGTILLGALGNLAGLIHHARLGRFRLPAAFDPRFTRDRMGLFLACGPQRTGEAKELLSACGAEELRSVE